MIEQQTIIPPGDAAPAPQSIIRLGGAMPTPLGPLPAEINFYEGRSWCLNPHPTFAEALQRLREEAGALAGDPADWQSREIATNLFLLASAALNCADEFLRGPTLKLPRKLASTAPGRSAKWTAELLWTARPGLARSRRWRGQWVAGLNDFLAAFVRQPAASAPLREAGEALARLTQWPAPAALAQQQISVPSPFRRLDMTHVDVLSLARRFAELYPGRDQPVLLVGLRTSGSYFAPLARAYLESQGFARVSYLTIEPNKGLGRSESRELKAFARQGYMALLVDDPPNSAGTIFTAINLAKRAGFASDRIKALVPLHPAKRGWVKTLPDDQVIALEPAQWHLPSLFEPDLITARLAEYFGAGAWTSVRLAESAETAAFNAQLRQGAGLRGARLKRVYEARLTLPGGGEEVLYVLAKGVGWGWLGYHAFLAGHRLQGLVPPLIGLRDGILYTQWVPQPPAAETAVGEMQRQVRIDAATAYVAARALSLALSANPVSGQGQQRHHNGLRLLEKSLSRAYGPPFADRLMAPSVGRQLRQMPCPAPTLIDGKIARQEWIDGPDGLLKTDFEQHGMGKAELNLADPAYDLADTAFALALDPQEEARMLSAYVATTGDSTAGERLFLHKLLAGLWAMEQAQEAIFAKRQTGAEQRTLHRQFLRAWDFLTVHTARHCGAGLRAATAAPVWRAPLVFLDIDGVIDTRTFGFPSISAAGIEALALLQRHDVSVALNTARSASEVKDYCAAYGLCGGVAEHGAYLWDAVEQRGRVLISAEAARQLGLLRQALQRLPGVFLDDRHLYSIRAFTYREKPRGIVATLAASLRASSIGDGAVAPLPLLTINALLSDLGLDRLEVSQTSIDTTVICKETDKGTGLAALRDWTLGQATETIAVGDSEPDLAMFRAATRSFAPANISCAAQARPLGCKVASQPHQRGLLEIARRIVHAEGQQCPRCTPAKADTKSPQQDLLFNLLQAADRSRAENMIRAAAVSVAAPLLPWVRRLRR